MKMNPMQNKTPEERKIIIAKGVATRRARLDAENARRQEVLAYAGGLREQIVALELKLGLLQRMEIMNAVSAEVTGKALLREEEIAKAALYWGNATGVYFLLDGDEVVYVGQAINIYSRISQHKEKCFDRFAFVLCAVDALDKLESLYIHVLRPRLNGNHNDICKCAPLSMDALTGSVLNEI